LNAQRPFGVVAAMLTLRFDRGRRGLRLSATGPKGVVVLLAAYLAAWTLSGRQLTKADAEAAIRAHLSFELSRAQVAALSGAALVPDRAAADRWAKAHAALDSVRVASLAIRRSLLDGPLTARADFTVRVQFSNGVAPPVRYFRVRKSPLGAAMVRWETSAWAWRLRL
jgi:hypothetical protein